MPQSFDAPHALAPLLARPAPHDPGSAPRARAPYRALPPTQRVAYPSLADANDGAPEGPGDAAAAPAAGSSLQHLLARWSHDPFLFAWEVFGLKLWSKQRLICRLVAKTATGPVRIAVASGHKTGKSKMLAVIAIWFAITRPAGRVIITAPTARQIRDTLWREVTALYKAASTGPCKEQPNGSLLWRAGLEGLGGKLNEMPASGLRFPDGSQVLGFSTNSPERMAGTSGEHLLYLIDEASGVEQPIFDAIEGNRAGDASVVMFSNPTRTSGYFFEAFHGRNKLYWHRVTISSEDTPNAVSGKKEIPGLATRAYIFEKRDEWGPDAKNDPRYQVRILGQFPRTSVNQIVPLERIEAGKKAWYLFAAEILGRHGLAEEPGRWKDIVRSTEELRRVQEAWRVSASGPLTFGVDPAWQGDDQTVIFARRGLRMLRPDVLKFTDGKDVADAVMRMVRAYRRGADERPRVRIDAIGIGAAAVERLREEPEIVLIEINSSKPAARPEDYRNLRTEMLFSTAQWLKAGGGFEPDPELERDLGAATYIINLMGQSEAEPKKAIKKRLGRSPDRGDAFSLCTYDSTLITQRVLSVQRSITTPDDPSTVLRDLGERTRGF